MAFFWNDVLVPGGPAPPTRPPVAMQGLPFVGQANFTGVPYANMFPGADGLDEQQYAYDIYQGALERTIPQTQVAPNAGMPFTPTPKGDIQPDQYYSIDPIYLKNMEKYKSLGKRLNQFELAQKRAFIKRQITEDLSRSRTWPDVMAKARSYRLALFKEDARRAAREHDRKIKNIQMERALAIHNLKFQVDEPLITSNDIDGIVGGLGRGIKGVVPVEDREDGPPVPLAGGERATGSTNIAPGGFPQGEQIFSQLG